VGPRLDLGSPVVDDHVGSDAGLVLAHVREQHAPVHVADGVEPVARNADCLEPVVHLDRLARLEADGLEPEVGGRRAAPDRDEDLVAGDGADVAARLSHVRISRSPSMGGIAATEPVATTTARSASRRRRVPSGASMSTSRSPTSRPRPRTSVPPAPSSQRTWPASSQWPARLSRLASAASTSSAPVTASAAPGTRRASASTSPGRSSPLLGMHAQYEHSPPRSSASTTAIRKPQSPHRPAMFSPAGPPPITTTSKWSIPPSRSTSSVAAERRRYARVHRLTTRDDNVVMT